MNVAEALAVVDLGFHVVEYQFGYGWYQIRDNGDACDIIAQWGWDQANVGVPCRWDRVASDVGIIVTEFRQSARLVPLAHADEDPETRGPVTP